MGIVSPRLGSEKKKNSEKVGKFGLGFSSVYHVTGKNCHLKLVNHKSYHHCLI